MRCEAATGKFFSELQSSSMEVLCIVVAALEVIPHRSQFFQYENISLSCVEPGVSSEWRLKRNTTKNKNEECSVSWGKMKRSKCYIDDLLLLDTGVYWCEFGAGTCSDAVTITVTGDPVILESPVHPVQEGEAVTLRCKTSDPAANATARFYKDGLLIGSSSTRNITIHSVSEADEGLYECDVEGAGGSRSSRLTVRGRLPGIPPPRLPLILPPVLGVCLLVALVTLLHLRRKHKGQIQSEVSYTDVSFTQDVQVRRDTEINTESVFYSTLSLASA